MLVRREIAEGEKMEKLKSKIAEAMKLKFVGDYWFSDEELSEIYSYTGKKLREFDFGYINKITSNKKRV